MRPIDIVRKACPRAKATYLAAVENGDGLFVENGITTPQRLAHFLAQICHESGGLTIDWESGNYSADRLVEIFGVGHHSAGVTMNEAETLAHNGPAIFERVYGVGNPKKSRELGNIKPGDGWRYRGGGLMQTTGRANYARMGKKCGVDFETNPELVLSAAHALKPALTEWTEGHLNEAADDDNILKITKRINGGTNGLPDRRAWLAKLKPLCVGLELGTSPIPPPPDIPKPIPLPPQKPKGPIAAAVALVLAALGWGWAGIQSHPYATTAAVILLVVAAIAIIKFKRD